jgi:transposase, IS5 family
LEEAPRRQTGAFAGRESKGRHETGALRRRDLERVTVDTTVQPKAITFPTDAKLLHAAIKGLNRLDRKCGVRLRQSYLRIAKCAAGRCDVQPCLVRQILDSRTGRSIRMFERKCGEAGATKAPFVQAPIGTACG